MCLPINFSISIFKCKISNWFYFENEQKGVKRNADALSVGSTEQIHSGVRSKGKRTESFEMCEEILKELFAEKHSVSIRFFLQLIPISDTLGTY